MVIGFKGMIDFSEIWEILKMWIEYLNNYGFPIPLILLICLLFLLLRMGKWSEREKYYYVILGNLGKWKDTVTERLSYYQEPGSEYQYVRNERYMAIEKRGEEAVQVLKDEINVARIFLSKKSVRAFEELIREHWYVLEHGTVYEMDYLEKTLPLVERAYASILDDARKDLKKSRFLAMFKNLNGAK